MNQHIIDLYDAYTHGAMDRRVFLSRLAAVAGSAAAASAALSILENDYAQAALIAEDDMRLETSQADYLHGNVRISGNMAKPRDAAGQLPAVLVIHENRGLNPHIADVARRFAVEGFLAFAPDMLSPQGGTPKDEDAAREMIRALDPDETVRRLVSAAALLRGHDSGNGKVGAVGFCWGGGMVNRLAADDAKLNAAVAYYGRQVDAAAAARIKAALMLHYAELDTRINAGIPDYEAALKANNVAYELHMYNDAQHAFNNDTNAARYNKQAAALAWSRTVAFLKKHLA